MPLTIAWLNVITLTPPHTLPFPPPVLHTPTVLIPITITHLPLYFPIRNTPVSTLATGSSITQCSVPLSLHLCYGPPPTLCYTSTAIGCSCIFITYCLSISLDTKCGYNVSIAIGSAPTVLLFLSKLFHPTLCTSMSTWL